MSRTCPRGIAGAVALAALLACGAGCKSRPATPADDAAGIPTPPPVAREADLLKRPAIDLSRGTAGFPLQTAALPAGRAAVADALRAGYALRLTDSDHVRIDAAGPDAGLDLESLTIDISGSRVRPEYVPKVVSDQTAAAVATVRAGVLTYNADPLHYQGSDASLRLVVSNAELGVLPASDGSFGLSLMNCDRGRALLKFSLDGLRQSLAGAIKVHRSLAFQVDSVELQLSSDSPRSLAADVVVHSRLLLVPATFRLTGRTDVDDAFNIHFSRLNATGLDPTGAVVAGLVQMKLDKVNNRAARLLKLPGDQVRVDAFSIGLDQELTIDVGLRGTVPGAAQTKTGSLK